MNNKKHKYKQGDRVLVKIFDWIDDKICSKIVPGTIFCKIIEPFGYDIQLDNKISFHGNMPFAFSTSALENISYNDNDDTVTCQTIFAKESCINYETNIDSVLPILQNHFRNMILRRCNVVKTVPADTISYISYFKKDGSIITLADDKEILGRTTNLRDEKRRLAYKLPHYFGFTKFPDSNSLVARNESEITMGKQLHFTENRRGTINFWNGFSWDNADATAIYSPSNDDIICGIVAQMKTGAAPSYDNWFVCSEQLARLITYINHPTTIPPDENTTLNSLLIPNNSENYYIPHEQTLSRYIYVAIFCIAVLKQTTLPDNWNLPEKKSPISSKMEPFAIWWTRELINSNK